MLLVEGLEVSNNLTGLAPDDLFRPTFTRESANCVKMSKIIRQKSDGEVQGRNSLNMLNRLKLTIFTKNP